MKNSNQREEGEREPQKAVFRSAKEIALIAVFCAVLLGGQFCFSFLMGVEIVSVLLATFSYVFGKTRGVICAVAFSLLRCFLFGFFLSVFLLYLLYYPLFAFLFGALGKKKRGIVLCTACALVATTVFTFLDSGIMAIVFSFGAEAWKAYLLASLPVLGVQLLSVGVSFALLFYPLKKAFSLVRL